MTALRRYASILWAIAILLMAGGQFQQAGASSSCADDHAHEHVSASGSDTANADSCPVEEHCCNACGGSFLVVDEIASLPLLPHREFSYQSRDESCLDAPRAEIDHPPQLS